MVGTITGWSPSADRSPGHSGGATLGNRLRPGSGSLRRSRLWNRGFARSESLLLGLLPCTHHHLAAIIQIFSYLFRLYLQLKEIVGKLNSIDYHHFMEYLSADRVTNLTLVSSFESVVTGLRKRSVIIHSMCFHNYLNGLLMSTLFLRFLNFPRYCHREESP
jgi:hypothetical protein